MSVRRKNTCKSFQVLMAGLLMVSCLAQFDAVSAEEQENAAFEMQELSM